MRYARPTLNPGGQSLRSLYTSFHPVSVCPPFARRPALRYHSTASLTGRTSLVVICSSTHFMYLDIITFVLHFTSYHASLSTPIVRRWSQPTYSPTSSLNLVLVDLAAVIDVGAGGGSLIWTY